MSYKYIYIVFLFSFLAGFFVLVSCDRERLDDDASQQKEQVPDEDVIKAVFPVIRFADEDGTRTTYSEAASGNFAWEVGDQIRIIYDIQSSGTNSFRDVIADLTPVSGSEHIATISGFSASDINTNYPCIAYYSASYSGQVFNSENYIYLTTINAPQREIDISSNPYSDSCKTGLVAVYNPSTKEFVFNHFSEGFLRFVCNNVPVNTNYLTVSIASSQNIYGSYGLTYFAIKNYYSKNDGIFNDVSISEYGIDDCPITFSLFSDSSGLPSAAHGIRLNLPLLAVDGENISYTGFTVKAYKSDGTELASKTINSTAQLDPGWAYRYSVNWMPLTLQFGGGTATSTVYPSGGSFNTDSFLTAENQGLLDSVTSTTTLSITNQAGSIMISDSGSADYTHRLVLHFSTPITVSSITVNGHLSANQSSKYMSLYYPNYNSSSSSNHTKNISQSTTTLTWSGRSDGFTSPITLTTLGIGVNASYILNSITFNE